MKEIKSQIVGRTRITETSITELEVDTNKGQLGIPETALVISQIFRPLDDKEAMNDQILVIAESEIQCFQALKMVYPQYHRKNLKYDRGAYLPAQPHPYEARPTVFVLYNGVRGLEAGAIVMSFAMFMDNKSLEMVQEFLSVVWE